MALEIHPRYNAAQVKEAIASLAGQPYVLVDSNVLFDVATNDPQWGLVRARIGEVAEHEALIINPIIYAEVSIGYPIIEALVRIVWPLIDLDHVLHLGDGPALVRTGFMPVGAGQAACMR